MNYTLEHLRIVYNAGTKKFPFEKAVELISLLGNESVRGLLADSGLGSSHTTAPKRRGRPKSAGQTSKVAPKIGRKKRRGGLSEAIVAFLKTKGPTGAHVKEIAGTTGGSVASVTAWFYTTGKKFLKSKEIKKVAPATFAFSEKAA